MSRKLVTIQEVKEVKSIEGADNIEIVKVLGWQCVAQKGLFKKGDKGIYFEVDSFLPIREEFEFLRKSCYRNNEYTGEGFKISTMRLRGELSQGLMLPLDFFKEISNELINKNIGDDVTNIIGVKKWSVPEVQGDLGIRIGTKPFGIRTTDELRVQSYPLLHQKLLGKPYYIAVKDDGTSCTIYHKDGVVGVCGRTDEYKEDVETSSMWRYVKENDVDNKLKNFGRNIAIQGEFCGQGIQKNKLKLKTPELHVFNVINLDTMERLGLQDSITIVSKLGLSFVKVEEVGYDFNYSIEELIEMAKGSYPSGELREGIVVRPIEPEYVKELGCSLSFKVLNNQFLLKED